METTTKTLNMVFLNESGAKVQMNISSVKTDITDAQVKTLMDLIIAKNIFESKGGDLKTIDSAQIVEKSTTPLTVK